MVDATSPGEIILDPGAEVSALPRNYGNVGTEVGQHEAQFIDAQGSPLHVHSTRVAKVPFGNVVLKERFIVTDVSIPILGLGHLVRARWSLQADGRKQFLVKGSQSLKVGFKRSSLRAVGCINMIASSDTDVWDDKRSSVDVSGNKDDGATSGNNASTSSGASYVKFCKAVDAAEFIPADDGISKSTHGCGDLHGKLPMQLHCNLLRPGWNKISPHLFAIATTVPEYVDTTLCPSDELMWLRTTLVKFADGWRLFEFCKQVCDLQGLTEKMRVGRGFQGVLTLAHVYAIPPERLGFNVDPTNLPALAQQVQFEQPADEMQDEAEAREVPVEVETGEARQEDRAVEALVEHDAVIVDGVQLSLNSSLANIRIGCESLGLFKRGGKEKCLKRMLEHVSAQEFTAATSATVKVQRENVRVPVEQAKPVVPTQAMVDEHSLTHYPYAQWCETYVMHKARQDAHVVQEHDRKQHSVISFDFGYAARVDGDKLRVLSLHDHVHQTDGCYSYSYSSEGWSRFQLHSDRGGEICDTNQSQRS